MMKEGGGGKSDLPENAIHLLLEGGRGIACRTISEGGKEEVRIVYMRWRSGEKGDGRDLGTAWEKRGGTSNRGWKRRVHADSLERRPGRKGGEEVV